jgi:hypothetical protein
MPVPKTFQLQISCTYHVHYKKVGYIEFPNKILQISYQHTFTRITKPATLNLLHNSSMPCSSHAQRVFPAK